MYNKQAISFETYQLNRNRMKFVLQVLRSLRKWLIIAKTE